MIDHRGSRFQTIRRIIRQISNQLPPLNFITLHYAYVIGTCLVASIIFWGSSSPPKSVTYTDSLFLVVSAMTLAGLNTINLSELNVFQQFILFALTLLGSAILVSIVVVHVRKKAFERRFKSAFKDHHHQQPREQRRDSARRSSSHADPLEPIPAVDGVVVGGSMTKPPKQPLDEKNGMEEANPGNCPPADREQWMTNGVSAEPEHSADDIERFSSVLQGDHDRDHLAEGDATSRRITFASPSLPTKPTEHARVFSMQGVGARRNIMNHPNQSGHIPYSRRSSTVADVDTDQDGPLDLIPPAGFIERNSQFSSLTLAERDRLGGVEYRAIKFLALIVPLYFVLWQLLGSISLAAYVARNRAEATLVNGLNPWWVGAFNAISAFNNNGMSLLDANMVAFQTSNFMLITMGLLILAGNTCYPIFLRLIIWTLLRLTPETKTSHSYRITLRFLLDHPRRCYTTLFPSAHTWWLLATLITLNGIDWVAFEVLNLENPVVTSLPRGVRVLAGLFQALAVRSGGFYVVTISQLRIGLLTLYVIMMYISVYPVVITMRHSNVYEERSLGIYADGPQETSSQQSTGFFGTLRRQFTHQGRGKESLNMYFVRQQLQGQLSHDLWWIVLAVLFITIIETGQFKRDPIAYTSFNVLFEVVSGYGCVGISVGLPNAAYSFSGGWHILSKLILCAVMIRGRHRGLPVAIDRAVLLPDDHLAVAEEEDAQIRLERTMSAMSMRTWGGVGGFGMGV